MGERGKLNKKYLDSFFFLGEFLFFVLFSFLFCSFYSLALVLFLARSLSLSRSPFTIIYNAKVCKMFTYSLGSPGG